MRSIQPEEKLPFDVLGLVFEHYAEKETIYHPIETLLLVCQSWNEAAVGHRNLWGGFRIHLTHEPSSTMWTKRVPLRLARCGPKTPLHIELRNLLDFSTIQSSLVDERDSFWCPFSDVHSRSRECPCHSIARGCAEFLLQYLAGYDGEYSTRWRSLILDFGHDDMLPSLSMASAIALSFPTPNLTNLGLNNMEFSLFSSESPIFPHIPRLESVAIVNCSLPTLSDFKNVRKAEVGWYEKCRGSKYVSNFRYATRLHSLFLRPTLNGKIFLPARLSELRVLRIMGDHLPSDLINCHVPQLAHLDITFHGDDPRTPILSSILRCQGIPIETLKEIKLNWSVYTARKFYNTSRFPAQHFMDVHESAQELLTRAKGLETICAEEEMLNIIIKVLWDLKGRVPPPPLLPLESPYGTSIVNSSSKSTVFIPRDASTLFFEDLARHWRLVPPNLPRKEFYNQVSYLNF